MDFFIIFLIWGILSRCVGQANGTCSWPVCNAQQHVETVGQNEAHTADLLGQEPGCGGEQHGEHQHLLVVPATSLSQSVRPNNTGAGIAQWLERRTRDWKVAGSNPCWNGGRIFFSRVDFLCWLLFRYPFHPRVTTVARKKSRSFCQKCRWQVTAKHAYTLRMWLLLNRASALVTTCP